MIRFDPLDLTERRTHTTTEIREKSKTKMKKRTDSTSSLS